MPNTTGKGKGSKGSKGSKQQDALDISSLPKHMQDALLGMDQAAAEKLEAERKEKASAAARKAHETRKANGVDSSAAAKKAHVTRRMFKAALEAIRAGKAVKVS